jgi:hypothetical protein
MRHHAQCLATSQTRSVLPVCLSASLAPSFTGARPEAARVLPRGRTQCDWQQQPPCSRRRAPAQHVPCWCALRCWRCTAHSCAVLQWEIQLCTAVVMGDGCQATACAPATHAASAAACTPFLLNATAEALADGGDSVQLPFTADGLRMALLNAERCVVASLSCPGFANTHDTRFELPVLLSAACH